MVGGSLVAGAGAAAHSPTGESRSALRKQQVSAQQRKNQLNLQGMARNKVL